MNTSQCSSPCSNLYAASATPKATATWKMEKQLEEKKGHQQLIEWILNAETYLNQETPYFIKDHDPYHHDPEQT